MSGLVEGATTTIETLLKGTPDAEDVALPEKTEQQKQLEAEQAESARQTSLKTEREKQSRERGATGRRSLTYASTGGQSVATATSKLGGGS